MVTSPSSNIKTIPPLRCDVLQNVTLLPMVGDITGPTHVYALGAHAQKEPLFHTQRLTAGNHKALQLPCIKPWNVSPQEVIYGGIFYMHWGHFLLEGLQRLWYAKQSALPIVWAGVWGVFHTPSQLKPWQSDVFKNLGIHNKHIFLTEPTQFAKVHFPEPACGINTHLHPEQVDFLGYYEAKPIQGKYVYFSRAKIRGCANEEHIEKILRQRGWSIVYPEMLSVAEQLHAISTAKVCFMIGGSAQHSLLLTKNLQTRFIIIPREHSLTFNLIAHAKSHDYFLFHLEKTVLHKDCQDEANTTFTLDVHTLEYILEKTSDFTKHVEDFPKLFTKVQSPLQEQLSVPAAYYAKPASITKGRKLFYHAYFLYQQKKYRTAAKLFTYLRKKHLLEESMYVDYFTALQRYHLLIEASITLPLEKHQRHIQSLQTAIAHNTQDHKSYTKLTELFVISGKVDEAIALQKDLAARHPQWSEPLAKIASLYSLQGHKAKALHYAQEAVNTEPHQLQRKAELIKCHMALQDFTTCTKLLSQSLLRHPTWDEGFSLLAAVQHAQGQLDKAIACMQKALTLAPHNHNALEQLATYVQEKGEHAQAIELFAKSLQQNPRAAERHAQNAHIYAQKNDFAMAIEHARKAVALEPRNFVCKSFLATYLRQNKEYKAAVELMEEAVHMNPFWSEPHSQMAAIYADQGNLDAALTCARKAVAVEPYSRECKAALANYRMQKRQITGQSAKHYGAPWARLQWLLDIVYAKNYLEIGMEDADTFLHLDVPFKMRLEGEEGKNTAAHEPLHVYREKPEVFFAKLPLRLANTAHDTQNKKHTFDIMVLNGAQGHEQCLKNFTNTLPYGHAKSLWLITHTMPQEALQKNNVENMQDTAKIQDAFKTILTIHDTFPSFSYCTQVYEDGAQTLLWRTDEPSTRSKAFEDTFAIKRMSAEDLGPLVELLNIVAPHQVLGRLFSTLVTDIKGICK